MFPFQPRDELDFGNPTSSIICQEDIIFPADHHNLIVDHVFPPNNLMINFSSTDKKQSETRFELRESEMEIKKDEFRIVKKVMHRDIERQRRQHMSKLYASLRSLLPLDKIKGKRAICDHMQEATKYIKELQRNVQELRFRRDKLKEISKSSCTKTSSSNESDDFPFNVVKVNSDVNGTIEILISIKNCEFKVSRVMEELNERGMHVVSYVSTKINERFIHKIQTEASDARVIDPSMLQETLMFPFQPLDELDFGNPTSSIIFQEDNIFPADHHNLFVDHVFPPNNMMINFSSTSDNTKRQQIIETQSDLRESEIEIKKGMHREIERQRRQEMSKLYASLRSLLPLEKIKGKRAVSDHMQEATEYIKELRKNVQKLGFQRDKLKEISKSPCNKTASSNESDNLPFNVVKVNSDINGTIEILISIKKCEFKVSHVMEELKGRGIQVVSCVSTKINEGFIHNIQVEVNFCRTRVVHVFSILSLFLQGY
ncbi:hypothetical protein ACJIZ3_009281 [Penstemon smallii]|uniref:BHLH domain-containing protein n=1 Tax=Penstemon smallii TaxID=265156 RepID=A0ABD3TC26_9LAMI